ncbi:hypothetical protein GO755_16455 [Spirosoma sp. HMF4905]|uniref:HTH luxR-type domain-containing protein n=1 Tax=Spirosoma arboris TaxID=2682092 RepID=A0A7K1SCY7_9BACT|nr:response regulator transcription factor [Spirosoma arboris]MVM31640.1 hypothetical protein [Spirosoma arboris]
MFSDTDSLNSIVDDWRDNVPAAVWAKYDPANALHLQADTQKLPEWLQMALNLICCPGIYSYYLVEITTSRVFYLGGDVKHTFGVTDGELATHSFSELVNLYIHPDDQIAFNQFVQKAVEFGLAHNQGRTLKRTYFYRQVTADGRNLQVMHQGQTLFYDQQRIPTAQLEVIVDVSHIRPPDALPMMTLMDMVDPENPVFFSMTLEKPEVTPTACPLGTRELEIMRLLADGKTSKQIAYLLNISPNTVNNHRQHILEKMNAQSTVEAINLAVRNGCL